MDGPEGSPCREVRSEGVVGGKWRAQLKGKTDGDELWQGGFIREAVPNEKLVFTFKWEDNDSVDSLVTYELSDAPGGTRMVFTQTPFTSEAERDAHIGGGNSTFDRLAELVER